MSRLSTRSRRHRCDPRSPCRQRCLDSLRARIHLVLFREMNTRVAIADRGRLIEELDPTTLFSDGGSDETLCSLESNFAFDEKRAAAIAGLEHRDVLRTPRHDLDDVTRISRNH